MDNKFDKQIVFIIGSPRSGTTWLQSMLGSHSSVCTTDELNIFGSYVRPLVRAWERQLSVFSGKKLIGLPTVWSEGDFYDFCREFVFMVYEQAVKDAKDDCDIFIDKGSEYSTCVDLVNKIVPNAKFIHIIRDGRDVCGSLISASQGWGRNWAPQTVKEAASLWNDFTVGARQAHIYEERYMEVRYEDLFLKGEDILDSLFEFIGLSVTRNTVRRIYDKSQFDKMKQKGVGIKSSRPEGFFRKGKAGSWKECMDPLERYKFHRSAGDLLRELGYADDLWWAEHTYQSAVVPLLFFVINAWDRFGKAVNVLMKG